MGLPPSFIAMISLAPYGLLSLRPPYYRVGTLERPRLLRPGPHGLMGWTGLQTTQGGKGRATGSPFLGCQGRRARAGRAILGEGTAVAKGLRALGLAPGWRARLSARSRGRRHGLAPDWRQNLYPQLASSGGGRARLFLGLPQRRNQGLQNSRQRRPTSQPDCLPKPRPEPEVTSRPLPHVKD